MMCKADTDFDHSGPVVAREARRPEPAPSGMIVPSLARKE